MGRRILIVDDEDGLADVLAEILSECEYEVRIATNGQMGLELLEESPSDLVLLDVMMPILTGPEMLKAMRRDPRFAEIPVILMTAAPEFRPDDEALRYQALISKPFFPRQLFALLDALLGKGGRHAGLDVRAGRDLGDGLGRSGATGGEGDEPTR